MQTPFSTIRTVAHILKIIAILKPSKLALRHLSAIMTQSLKGRDEGEGKLSLTTSTPACSMISLSIDGEGDMFFLFVHGGLTLRKIKHREKIRT